MKNNKLVTKPQAAWEQLSGFEWHLLKQCGTLTSIQRRMNGLKRLSMDDRREVGEQDFKALQPPPRKQVKSEPDSGIRK